MSKKRLFTIKRTAASNSSIISAPESMIKKNLIILKKIEKFSPTTTLSANPQKTEYMFIGHPNRTNKITEQEKLKLNGSEIKRVKK